MAARGGGTVILFNLVVLRAEARPVQNLNDASVHRSMIAWASDRIEEGHLPFDGWCPYLAPDPRGSTTTRACRTC